MTNKLEALFDISEERRNEILATPNTEPGELMPACVYETYTRDKQNTMGTCPHCDDENTPLYSLEERDGVIKSTICRKCGHTFRR